LGLPDRFEQEAQNLARMTNWPIAEIRDEMETNDQSFTPPSIEPDKRQWWEKLWPED